MATTKKKTPVKKSSTSKAKNTKATARPWSLRFSLLTVGIYAIVVTTIVVAAFATSYFMSAQQNKARLERIQAIYASLELPESYQVERTNVFGDKRVYEWDKSRTYSSEINYLHGDTVGATFADLDARVKAAGFTFVGEPYPGSVSKQYHYKSAEGEYIRVSVSSKVYNDAWRNAALMKQDVTQSMLDQIDTNSGPADVTIKVNLNDNNE